jgi:hypothetical protein
VDHSPIPITTIQVENQHFLPKIQGVNRNNNKHIDYETVLRIARETLGPAEGSQPKEGFGGVGETLAKAIMELT